MFIRLHSSSESSLIWHTDGTCLAFIVFQIIRERSILSNMLLIVPSIAFFEPILTLVLIVLPLDRLTHHHICCFLCPGTSFRRAKVENCEVGHHRRAETT